MWPPQGHPNTGQSLEIGRKISQSLKTGWACYTEGWVLPWYRTSGVCSLLCLNWMLWEAFTPNVSKETCSQEPSVPTSGPRVLAGFSGTLESCHPWSNVHWLLCLPPFLSAAIQNSVPYLLLSLTIPGPLGTQRACNPAAGQAPSQAMLLSYPQVSCLWFALL